jgi:hypothetical protein
VYDVDWLDSGDDSDHYPRDRDPGYFGNWHVMRVVYIYIFCNIYGDGSVVGYGLASLIFSLLLCRRSSAHRRRLLCWRGQSNLYISPSRTNEQSTCAAFVKNSNTNCAVMSDERVMSRLIK